MVDRTPQSHHCVRYRRFAYKAKVFARSLRERLAPPVLHHQLGHDHEQARPSSDRQVAPKTSLRQDEVEAVAGHEGKAAGEVDAEAAAERRCPVT